MNEVIAVRRFARQGALALGQTALLLAFAATLFLSALLLFSIQPIFAKMVLPKLGGSPSVWAVSMVFFQGVLFAGYCYAHLLNRFLELHRAFLLHIGLLGLVTLALPFGLPSYAAEPPEGGAYVWLIGVLAVGVGLPFLAVSGNAPLLQAWFARSGHRHAADPYFLYAASNLGSLVALLAYPIVIEPILGLATQSQIWTGAFVLLGFMIAASATLTLVRQKDMPSAVFEARSPVQPIAWGRRWHWLVLAAVPSGLLVAFTSYVTTDIASAPFLWVLPLSVFLATFMLVFREKPAIPHHLLLLAQPVLVAATLFGLTISGNRGWLLGIVAGFGSFFVTTMVCHRELYDARPDSGRLTEFYLWMSLGGVLGGIFSALVAPQIFNTLFEFPLLLVAGLACRPGVRASMANAREAHDAGLTAAVLGAMTLALAVAVSAGLVPSSIEGGTSSLAVVVFAILMLSSMHKPLHVVVFSAAMGLALYCLPSAMRNGFSERSFFGVHRVTTIADGSVRVLMHGTTVHGAQRIKDLGGNAVTVPTPATYYYPHSPMARGVEVARIAAGRSNGELSVGVVGLGAGSLACYARSNEAWRFYEIDPVVVKLANDPQLFSFMSHCRPGADVVVGDARLTLAKAPARTFDYLVIDAFSSDAVPTHLLTREALLLYLDKLATNGLLALHVTNRHLDLVSVASAVATSIPDTYVGLVRDEPPDAGVDRAASNVVFVAKSPSALQPVLDLSGGKAIGKSDLVPWSDDFSDIMGAIFRRYSQK